MTDDARGAWYLVKLRACLNLKAFAWPSAWPNRNNARAARPNCISPPATSRWTARSCNCPRRAVRPEQQVTLRSAAQARGRAARHPADEQACGLHPGPALWPGAQRPLPAGRSQHGPGGHAHAAAGAGPALQEPGILPAPAAAGQRPHRLHPGQARGAQAGRGRHVAGAGMHRRRRGPDPRGRPGADEGRPADRQAPAAALPL